MTHQERAAILERVREMLDMEGVEAVETAGTETAPNESNLNHFRLDGSRVITISVPRGSYR